LQEKRKDVTGVYRKRQYNGKRNEYKNQTIYQVLHR